MSGQHRATPDQWAVVEGHANSAGHYCLLELRARVEALEATQHAHADARRLSDAEREQFYAVYAEMAKPAAVTRLHSYKVGEAEPIDDWGKGHTLVNPTPTPEARPAGLVERVAEAMQPGTFDWSAYEDEARAAIREVAAAAKDLRFATARALIAWLEREADRG